MTAHHTRTPSSERVLAAAMNSRAVAEAARVAHHAIGTLDVPDNDAAAEYLRGLLRRIEADVEEYESDAAECDRQFARVNGGTLRSVR